MKTSIPFTAIALLTLALAGCGDGSADRPSPTGAEIQAQNAQRQQSIDNNPNIPPEARDRIKATMGGGKR